MKLPTELSDLQIDHLGIAVNSIDEAWPFYQNLGFPSMQTEEVASQKVRVGFLAMRNSSNIELLEATSEDSPIAKFIAKKGPGIHHLCLKVQGIDALLIKLKGKGVRLIDETAKLGAQGCRVAFIHPSATGGVLIELSERV